MEQPPLRYWFWWPIRTYDTFEADTPPVMQLARNIYATLASSYIGGKPQGILAKEWRVSPDGKEWRFLLRTDLTFSDGSPITPEIVLLNFRRILWLTRKEGLVLNSLLPDVASWTSINHPSRALLLENGNELVFRFVRRPISLFEAINQPLYGIAHPKCFDEAGQWRDPLCAISSGQYTVAERGSHFIRLKSRKVYPSVDQAPDSVVIMWPNLEGDTAVKAIEERRGDLTVEHSFALGRKTLSRLERQGVRTTAEPPLRMHFVHLNHKRDPFHDRTTRQYFRDLFLFNLKSDAAFSSSGTEVDSSFIPKGGVGYKSFPIESTQATGTKALGKGRKVEVLFYPFSAEPDIQNSVERAVSETLKSLGFIPHVTRYKERFEAFNRMRSGDFDLIVRGTGILVNDPYGDLRMMFLSTVGARIPDPSGKIPQLIERAESEHDGETRGRVVGEINDLVHDEASIVTFAHSKLLYLYRGNVDFCQYNLFADPIEFRAVGWKK